MDDGFVFLDSGPAMVGMWAGCICPVADIVRFPSSGPGSGLPTGIEEDFLTKALGPQREEQHGNALPSVSISVHPWLNIVFRSCSSVRQGKPDFSIDMKSNQHGK